VFEFLPLPGALAAGGATVTTVAAAKAALSVTT